MALFQVTRLSIQRSHIEEEYTFFSCKLVKLNLMPEKNVRFLF